MNTECYIETGLIILCIFKWFAKKWSSSIMKFSLNFYMQKIIFKFIFKNHKKT